MTHVQYMTLYAGPKFLGSQISQGTNEIGDNFSTSPQSTELPPISLLYNYLLVLELTVALVMHCCFLLARSVVELVVVVTAFVIAESFSVLARSLLL